MASVPALRQMLAHTATRVYASQAPAASNRMEAQSRHADSPEADCVRSRPARKEFGMVMAGAVDPSPLESHLIKDHFIHAR